MDGALGSRGSGEIGAIHDRYKTFRTNFFHVIVIVLISILVNYQIVIYGPSSGPSGPFNFLWHMGFSRELASGVLYPRYVVPWPEHYGSFAFYFYGPIAYYLSAAFSAIISTGNPVYDIGLSYIWLHVLAGVAAYFSVGYVFGRRAGFAAAIVYGLAPFHLAELHIRSSMASATAFIFTPIVFAGLVKLARTGRGHLLLAAGAAGTVMAHIPSAIFLIMMMPFLALFAAREARHPVRFVVAAAVVFGFGIGVGAVYWLPALTLQDIMNPQRWWFTTPASNLFFDRPAEAGDFLQVTMARIYSTSLAATAILALALAISHMGAARRADRAAGAAVADLMIVLGAASMLALMTGIARPFWEAIPVLWRLQFAWRGMGQTDLFLILLTAMVVHRTTLNGGANALVIRIGRIAVSAAVLLMVLANLHIYRAWNLADWRVPAGIEDYAEIAFDPAEYVPAGVDLGRGGIGGAAYEDWRRTLAEQPMISVPEGAGDVAFVALANGAFRLQASMIQEATVTVKRLFLPFWRARQSGTGIDLPTSQDPQFAALRIGLPPGTYDVVVKLEKSKPEKIGIFLSVFSVAVLLVLSLVARSRRGRPARYGRHPGPSG